MLLDVSVEGALGSVIIGVIGGLILARLGEEQLKGLVTLVVFLAGLAGVALVPGGGTGAEAVNAVYALSVLFLRAPIAVGTGWAAFKVVDYLRSAKKSAPSEKIPSDAVSHESWSDQSLPKGPASGAVLSDIELARQLSWEFGPRERAELLAELEAPRKYPPDALRGLAARSRHGINGTVPAMIAAADTDGAIQSRLVRALRLIGVD
jgi:hypothetical protein